jgi:hypothetical protein
VILFKLIMSVSGSCCDYSITTGTKTPSYPTYHKKVVLKFLELSVEWADWRVFRETHNNHGASWYIVIAVVLLVNQPQCFPPTS